MNRFFIDEVAGEINNIKDKEDIKHILTVLRLKEDDDIEVVDINFDEYIMKIKKIQKDSIELAKLEKIDVKRECDIKITLYQGIPKAQKMEYICQKLTEVGIFSIVPVKFDRCVATDINDNKIQRLKKIIKEASKQSKRLINPNLSNPMTFEQILEDMKKNDKNILFYEEEKNKTIKDFINQNTKNIQSLGIIIGAEGGITRKEADILKQNNADVLSLGNTILRTETAGLVATSILIYEFENRIK